jgi:mycothiol synthase
MASGWRWVDELSASQRLEVLDLLNRLEAELGREALDEGRRRIVVHGWTGRHWLRYDDGHLAAYALSSGEDPLVVEVAGGGFDADLLASLRELAPAVEWWIRDGAGSSAPGEIRRTLRLLEVTLPVAVEAIPSEVTMRTFDPMSDSQAWLEQNNLAFADHPEQGAWRQSDLAMRLREPWFDPSGFLLFELDGQIVASCWTKVHELHPDRFGEIYVVSVHPQYQGRRLGAVAVTQGLETLRRKGVARAALFVDDSNTGALALYERLGFRTVREDHLLRFTGS